MLTLLTLPVIYSRVEAQTNQAVFTLSPNTGSFFLDDTIPVDLRINSTNSTGITSMKASLTFDAAKLEVVSLDSTQSSFSFQWEQAFDNTTGTISIQRSSSSPRLGDHLITKITFKAKSTTGTATIDYDSNCFVLSNPTCLALKPDDTNILALSNGASFTVNSSPQPTRISTLAPNPKTSSTGALFIMLLVVISTIVIIVGLAAYSMRKRRTFLS